MKSISILIFVFLFVSVQQNYAQNVKFGKVSKAELEEQFYPLDSSAIAAILYKKRRTYYEYSDSEGFMLITEVHERVKLYNKEGFDWATKSISLYTRGGSNERIMGLKANTYNLENNKVQVTKLKKEGIFKENINKYWNRKKFTLPNLKEGCVVEWKYKISSPFIWNIKNVVLQQTIPIKHIEAKVEIPEYYIFKNRMQGFYPINLERSKKNSKIVLTSKSRQGYLRTKTTFSQDKIDLTTNIISTTLNNVPAIKEEPYINNLNNYRAILKFEHTATRYPNSQPKFYNTTWEDVTKTIYKSPNFGGQLEKSSYFKDDLQSLVAPTASMSEKISSIFQFVKSKIKWNGFYGKYTLKGVKKAYNEGTGNVAEINLTLVAMLRKAGLDANPIIVSTRSHGIPLFPTSDGFNYVIAGVEVTNGVILMDATEKYSIPNVLPLRALNWQGRIVRKNGSSASLDLFPKKHTKEMCFLNAKIDDEGSVTGVERVIYSNLRALKNRAKNNGLTEESLIAKLEKKNNGIEINKVKVTNKDNIGKSLIYQFDFETEDQVEIIGGKIYFSPLLFLTQNENPFKLEDRKFPVDYGAPWEDKYTVSVEFPEGYTIESKPKNVAYSLPEGIGSYKFVTVVKGNKLQILSDIKVNHSIVSPIYYGALKEFYKKVIDNQLEKVVLVKN